MSETHATIAPGTPVSRPAGTGAGASRRRRRRWLPVAARRPSLVAARAGIAVKLYQPVRRPAYQAAVDQLHRDHRLPGDGRLRGHACRPGGAAICMVRATPRDGAEVGRGRGHGRPPDRASADVTVTYTLATTRPAVHRRGAGLPARRLTGDADHRAPWRAAAGTLVIRLPEVRHW